jgi:exosortase/archaeosortase
LRFIFTQDYVTGDLIAGAAVIYLVIAIIWTYIYRIIEMIHPGSFSIAESQTMDYSAPFLYYSFVTMTTLGYGDIFPVTTAAKSISHNPWEKNTAGTLS